MRRSEDIRSQPIPQALMDAMGKFVGEGLKSGVFLDAAGGKPSADGHRIRLSGGKLSVTDGPFAETKELIGGYALAQVKSKEEGLDLARKFMELHRAHWPELEMECEVRPLEDA